METQMISIKYFGLVFHPSWKEQSRSVDKKIERDAKIILSFFNSRGGYCTLVAINIFKYQSFKFHMVPTCVPMLNPMKIIQSKFLSRTVLNGLPCGDISKQFLWKRYRSDSALSSMIILTVLVISHPGQVLLYFRIQAKLVRWLLSVATYTSQIKEPCRWGSAIFHEILWPNKINSKMPKDIFIKKFTGG